MDAFEAKLVRALDQYRSGEKTRSEIVRDLQRSAKAGLRIHRQRAMAMLYHELTRPVTTPLDRLAALREVRRAFNKSSEHATLKDLREGKQLLTARRRFMAVEADFPRPVWMPAPTAEGIRKRARERWTNAHAPKVGKFVDPLRLDQ